ncbi:hypothetical protein NX907_28555, partial [Burkholderia thailandensis]|uniref:hypothetical protein n=1 Tax=Burkholderia thailandensis TaxID=57975 RepID=UPI00217ED428
CLALFVNVTLSHRFADVSFVYRTVGIGVLESFLYIIQYFQLAALCTNAGHVFVCGHHVKY